MQRADPQLSLRNVSVWRSVRKINKILFAEADLLVGSKS